VSVTDAAAAADGDGDLLIVTYDIICDVMGGSPGDSPVSIGPVSAFIRLVIIIIIVIRY